VFEAKFATTATAEQAAAAAAAAPGGALAVQVKFSATGFLFSGLACTVLESGGGGGGAVFQCEKRCRVHSIYT
jgi:hypothetical protein